MMFKCVKMFTFTIHRIPNEWQRPQYFEAAKATHTHRPLIALNLMNFVGYFNIYTNSHTAITDESFTWSGARARMKWTKEETICLKLSSNYSCFSGDVVFPKTTQRSFGGSVNLIVFSFSCHKMNVRKSHINHINRRNEHRLITGSLIWCMFFSSFFLSLDETT